MDINNDVPEEDPIVRLSRTVHFYRDLYINEASDHMATKDLLKTYRDKTCTWREVDIGFYARVTLKIKEFSLECNEARIVDTEFVFCPYCGGLITYEVFGKDGESGSS